MISNRRARAARGEAITAHLRDRVESEANRLLRERVERLRASFEEALTAASEPLRLPLTPGEWGAAAGTAQLHLIRDALEAISRHESQREILSALLETAASVYPRSALFILKSGTLSGWAGLGFQGEGGFTSDQVPRLFLGASGSHLLGRTLASRATTRGEAQGPGDDLRDLLGGVTPRDCCAAPVQVRGRIVAVLYGDTGAGAEAGDPLAFEILARVAGLAMERLTVPPRRGRAVPAEAVPGAGPHAATAAAHSSATPPEEAELQAILADLGGHPRPASADDGIGDEERRLRADARRFAHLLVSELLLYNEAAVVQGRKHRDLVARLRREIDRSRQAYQARFPGLASGAADYFDEELVRTLALGDPSLLGN